MTTVAPAANLVSTQPASPHGLAGFLCEVTGSPVTFADCLACAKSAKNTGCPLTVPIVQAILAGIRPLGEEDLEALESGRHPRPRIPESAVRQVTAKDDAAARQRAAVELALETAGRLSALEGLRGFSVSADGSPDAALEIIDKL